MTREQEQAASAARRDCINWLNSHDARSYAAALHDYSRFYCERNAFDAAHVARIKPAYEAAWRAQWEAR